MRPLESLTHLGVTYTKVPCDLDGNLDFDFLEKSISEKTKLIVMTHGSNVSGTILPLKKVGEIANRHGIRFIIDSAQTAGHISVNMEEFNADAIAFTGHKGLLGPQGIGGAIIKSEMVEEMSTFIEGGTGSKSDTEIQPDYMPDKYESGTPNIIGIIGLNVSLKYLFNYGLKNIGAREKEIREYFIDRVSELEDVRFVGSKNKDGRLGVISLDFVNADNAIVSNDLARTYGISNRCGMHCAPSAHKSFDTFPQGTVRLSVSHFSSKDDVDYTIDSIKKIMEEYD
jgi:selenocysteine lyase/cysteine desulfurase